MYQTLNVNGDVHAKGVIPCVTELVASGASALCT
jgi:hypothetical protein